VNRAAAILGTTALIALAGCATTTPGTGELAAGATALAGGGASSLPLPKGGSGAPTGSAAPSGTTLPPGTKTVTVGKATIPLIGVATASHDGGYLCLTLVDDTGCSLEVIDIGATRAAGGSVSDPAPGAPNGWWWGSDVPSCGSGNDSSAVATSKSVESGFRKVGSKNAAYGYWLVTCQNTDQNFDPRMWWLPTSQLAFREHDTVAGGGGAVDKILAGVTFGA
jgi:hypothetical protein